MAQEKRPAGSRRRYHSPVRQQQAAETRRRVVAAAADAFTEAGYEGATIARIAATAEVSPDTVMGVGHKSFLLLEAFRVRAMGDGGPGTLLERDFATDIFAITDPVEALTAVVAFIADAHARSADLWVVIRATAPTDPRVADVFDELTKSRDASYDTTLDWLVGLGAVPGPGSGADDVTAFRLDTRLALAAENYLQLTRDWSLSLPEYRAWLTGQLTGVR